MKCFSTLLLIFSLSLYGATYELIGEDQKQVGIGDIIELRVQSETVDLDYLKRYENTRISDLLYVLEVNQRNDVVYIKSIIADKTPKEKVQIEDIFKVKNVNFKYEKIKLDGSFKTLDSNIVLEKSKLILIVISSLMLLLFGFFIKKQSQKNKIKKKYNQMRSEIALNDKNLNREHFEKIYQRRDVLELLYSYDKTKLNSFFNALEQIQYKRSWSGEEYEQVLNEYKIFIKTVRVKNGV